MADTPDASPEAPSPATLDWREGDVPVSERWGDVYFSAEDGLAETRHVFLDGNRLPERMAGASAFSIGELGFGTGLNVLAAWELWDQVAAPGGCLNVNTADIAPMSQRDIARVYRTRPGLADRAKRLIEGLDRSGMWMDQSKGSEPLVRRVVVDLGSLHLTLWIGDARETVPRWGLSVSCWFLDGFAPARNPEMWEPALLQSVFAQTVPGGGFATYTAAGVVRRRLLASGFDVAKRPGFGSKRHMLTGERPAR